MKKQRWYGWFLGLVAALIADASADLQRMNVGVFGGQVRDISMFVDGAETNLFLAVECNRGVFRLDVTGMVWQTVTYPDWPGTASDVECARHSGYENNVYALITPPFSGVSLVASDRGGDLGSWNQLTSSGVNNPCVLVAHASGFYIGSRDGRIYRNTADTSTPFTQIYQHPDALEIMSISPYSSDLVMASVAPNTGYTNLFRLDWSGGAFVKTDLVMPVVPAGISTNIRVHLLGVEPGDSNAIYAAGSDNGETQIYRSPDGGSTWTESWYNNNGSGTFPGGYPHYLKFDHGRVFISHSTRNTSGSWTSVQNAATAIWDGSIISTHPNDAAIEVNPVDTTMVFHDTDWAVAQSSCSLAGDWIAGAEVGTNQGIAGVVLNDFDFHAFSASNKTLWVAAKSGIGRTLHFDPTRFGTTAAVTDWLFPLYPDGAPAHSIAIHPTNPAIVLAGYNSGRIFRSVNADETNSIAMTWSQVFFGGDYPGVFGTVNNDVVVNSLRFVPSTPDHVFAAGYRWQPPLTNGGIFFSSDAGLSWTNEFYGAPVNCLFVHDYATWAGVGSEESTERGLRARTGPGSWWQPLTGTSLDNEIVTGIDGVVLSSQAVVYVVTGGGGSATGQVYQGVNTHLSSGGFSNWVWSVLSGSIPVAHPADFSAVAIDPADFNRAFVAIENCIYETTDGGVSWSVFGTSCTDAHEAVRVLRYDDLMGGTSDGLFGYVLQGPHLRVTWDADTNRAHQVYGAVEPGGPYEKVGWSSSYMEGTRRVAVIELPTNLPMTFLRIETSEGGQPAFDSIEAVDSAGR